MSSDELKENIGKVIEQYKNHPAIKHVIGLLKEKIIPLVLDETKLILNNYFPEVKNLLKEVGLVSITEVLKKEFVHEFESKTLSKVTAKVTNPIVDRVAPKILERTNRDILNEDMLYSILSEIIKKVFLRKTEEAEPSCEEQEPLKEEDSVEKDLKKKDVKEKIPKKKDEKEKIPKKND